MIAPDAPDASPTSDPREPRPARTGTLRRDIDDWARFTVAERDVLLRLTVLFQAAEESMTRDLLPLIMTVVREARLEEQLFLTTFLADEAKHTEFFRGVLGDAGYHVFSTALARGDAMSGFREGLRHAQADEERHMAYGLFLLSRLVAEEPAVWSAVSRRMEELLPLTLGIVSELFEAYDPMPFGLSLDDTVQDAIARFASRWAALEGAREQGHALAGAVGTERTIRDLLGWVGAELQPASIEVRREGSSPVYTFQVGPVGASALLITQEVLAQHTATDVIAALRAHRVPERLRAGGRTRLTCLSARGKIIVQPPE